MFLRLPSHIDTLRRHLGVGLWRVEVDSAGLAKELHRLGMEISGCGVSEESRLALWLCPLYLRGCNAQPLPRAYTRSRLLRRLAVF